MSPHYQLLRGVCSKLNPYALSLAANLSWLIYILNISMPNSKIYLIANVSIGAVVAAYIFHLLHNLIHSSGRYLNFLAIVFGLMQLCLYLFSFGIVKEYGYLPTNSTIGFIIDYPLYSLILFWERVGLLEIAIVLVAALFTVSSWRNKPSTSPIDSNRFKRNGFAILAFSSLIIKLTFVSAHVDAIEPSLFKLIVNSSTDQSVEQLDKFVLNRIQLPKIGKTSKIKQNIKPNVLFIRLEEVSKNKYGLYENVDIPNTPFISKFSKENSNEMFVFNRHISNSGATDTSTTLIYTGLQSTRSGAEFGKTPMLWDYAKAKDYRTIMTVPFHIEWGNLNKKWASSEGEISLDYFVDAGKSGRKIVYDNSILDSDITEMFLEGLDSTDKEKPFFGILNYKMPHSDGEGVNEIGYDQLGCPSGKHELSHYECSIYSVDSHIQKLFSALKNRSLLENTVVVVTPDHGAAQFIREGRLDNYYQEVLSVPLYIYIPEKIQQGFGQKHMNFLVENRNVTTQNLDLVPTFLDILGIHDQPIISKLRANLDGKSLFRNIPKDRWILSMNSNALRPWSPSGFGITIDGRYKYIYFNRLEYLFDVIEDPAETHNLLDAPGKNDSDLYAEIRAYILSMENTKFLYAELYPQYKEKKSWTFLGEDLFTRVGRCRGDGSLESSDQEGVLSYGPYLKLPTGSYTAKIMYSSEENTAMKQPAKWKLGFFPNSSNSLLLGEGVFDRFGEKQNLNVNFLIDKQLTNKPLELVVRYTGGSKIRIDKLVIESE